MKILVADSIDNEAISFLKKFHEVSVNELTSEELIEQIHKYDAVIVRSRSKITSDVIKKGKSLKVIGRAGIGVDNISVETASQLKIPVVYAPLGSTISVAEATFGQILSLARDLTVADRSMKNGMWEKKKFKGVEVYGKTIGLIGIGRIGNEVAKRCQSFGMSVIAYDPYVSKEIEKKLNIKLKESLDDLLTKSDFVSIHAILTEETKNLISDKQFHIMKPTSYIINFSRGGIIEEAALVSALKEKLISGAALDVFSDEPLAEDSPLRDEKLPILLSPHIGASTNEAQEKSGLMVAQEVQKVLTNQKPDFCVNKEIYTE